MAPYKRYALEPRGVSDVLLLSRSGELSNRGPGSADAFDISVADLAIGLANVVGELQAGAIGAFKFEQGDDMLEISFRANQDSVTVSHNLAPDQRWACNRKALEKALINFIVSFTDEAAARVPDLFDWKDMSILQFFQPRTPRPS